MNEWSNVFFHHSDDALRYKCNVWILKNEWIKKKEWMNEWNNVFYCHLADAPRNDRWLNVWINRRLNEWMNE